MPEIVDFEWNTNCDKKIKKSEGTINGTVVVHNYCSTQ